MNKMTVLCSVWVRLQKNECLHIFLHNVLFECITPESIFVYARLLACLCEYVCPATNPK